MSQHFHIRPANEEDIPLILQFIRELAEYEKLAHEVEATEAQLRETLFEKPLAGEVVLGMAANEAVAMALFFHNYSTFLARPGLYLEDLYVRESQRGRGFGRAMLIHLAKLARERGCGRFEWSVLDWNTPAIGFYQKLGAKPMDGWTVYRVSGDALVNLAQMEV